jgi:phosphoglycolate phosphatase
MKLFDLLIFDFDGTLVDTRKSILETLRKTVEFMGLPPIDENAVVGLIGLPLQDTFEKAAGLSGQRLNEAIKIYRSIYGEIAANLAEPFPGVLELLSIYRKEGGQTAIASSKGKVAITDLLGKHNLSHAFNFIVADKDVLNKKPAPDMVLKILGFAGCIPEKALVIGDTKYDLVMGHRAGCFTCAAKYGYGNSKEMDDEKPAYEIYKFSELSPIVLNC